MQAPNNKLLVICYTFPPYPGIGGRRWAKFAKLLSRKGFEVYVACASNPYAKTSPWMKDVGQSKINVWAYNFKFEKDIKNPNGVTGKIKRRVINGFLNQTKYTSSIITSLPNRQIWRSIGSRIREHGIGTVITSGDPFLFYYSSELKKELGFKLVLDYRDLWNDHSFYKNKVKLTPTQEKFFQHAENQAVNSCDDIIFVDQHLESVVKKRITSGKAMTHVIPNGYDPEDLLDVIPEKNIRQKTLLFGGSISSDLNPLLLQFLSGFYQLSIGQPLLCQKFRIHIYGEMDETVFHEILQLNLSNVTIERSMASSEEYYKRLAGADAGLVILSEEYRHSFITKFTDYLLYNKFTIALGFQGDFASFVEKHGVGLWYSPSNNTGFFEKLFSALEKTAVLNEAEREKFNLHHLTARLVSEVIKK